MQTDIPCYDGSIENHSQQITLSPTRLPLQSLLMHTTRSSDDNRESPRNKVKNNMADENVLLEKSPLQKYLHEIGFTDFEKEEEQEKSRKNQPFFDGTWIKGLFHCFHNRTKLITCETFLSWFRFAITPPLQDLEAFRKDYIVAIAESQLLNEDDVEFLSRFDPELFECRRPCSSKERGSLLSRKYILASFVLLVSIILATGISASVLSSLPVVFAVFMAVGTKLLVQYYFKIHHQKNLGELKFFTTQVKELTFLLRKCIKLIQEMEVISKGYTMAGPGSHAFFLENYDHFIRSAVYPALRDNVAKNTEYVATCLQQSAKELFSHFPLSVEFAEVFTYFSTQSVANQLVGAGEVVQDGCPERVSLQGLKNGLSLVLSLQSEFLSRFLLSLSVKANDGNLHDLYLKLFTNVNKIFGISSKPIAASLTAIEKCYHLHDSFCFIKEESVKPRTTRPSTKWTHFNTALRSLQLHLQAGILRLQSFQEIIWKLSKSEAEDELKSTDLDLSDTNANLSVPFQWLKSDLESALTCWQEAERQLNKLLGEEPNTEQSTGGSFCHPVNNVILEESSELSPLDFKEEVSENDKVYEAFSDPYDDALCGHPASTAENLEGDLNAARKNKKLLQELKAVLFTKAKDPLIGAAGFVQPIKSPVHDNILDSANVKDETLCNGNTSLTSKKEAKEISGTSKWSETEEKNKLCPNEGCNQFPDEEAREQPMLFLNLQSSVAISAAAAAVTQRQTMGLYQDSFIIDDSD